MTNRMPDLFSHIKACQCCLSTDAEGGTLRLIKSLAHILNLLVGKELNLAELWLCNRCSHTLRKISLFRDLCSRAHAVLQEYSNIQDSNVARNYFLREKKSFSQGNKSEPSMSNTLCMSIAIGKLESPIYFESFNKNGRELKNYTDHIDAYHEFVPDVGFKVEPDFNTVTNEVDNYFIRSHEAIQADNCNNFRDEHYDTDEFNGLNICSRKNSLKESTLKTGNFVKKVKVELDQFLKTKICKSYNISKTISSMKKRVSKLKGASRDTPKSSKTKQTQVKPSSGWYKMNIPKDIAEELERACAFRLTYEEQMKEKEDRAKDESYLRAVYKCELCVITFQSQLAMLNHEKKHLESCGPEVCPVCSLRFTRLDLLSSHSNSHALRISCKICQRRFCNRTSYRDHLLWHKGNMKCIQCEKTFHSSSALREHRRRKHKTEQIKKYECDTCSKVFFCKSPFISHVKKHIGMASYNCPVCSKDLYSWSGYLYHLESHKTSKSDNYCVECDLYFKNAYTLSIHLKNVVKHQDPENLKRKCNICGENFPSYKILREHKVSEHGRESSFVCQTCSSSYLTQSGLSEHIKKVHQGYRLPKNFPCTMCEKTFAVKVQLANHIRTHTGERPFECVQCSDTFTQKSSLATHVKLVHLKIKRNSTQKKKKSTDNIKEANDKFIKASSLHYYQPDLTLQ